MNVVFCHLMEDSLGRAECPGGAPAHHHRGQVSQQGGELLVSVVIRETHGGDGGGEGGGADQLHDGDVIVQGGGVPARVRRDPGNLDVQGGLPGLPHPADVILAQPDHPRVPGAALETVGRSQHSVRGNEGSATHHDVPSIKYNPL